MLLRATLLRTYCPASHVIYLHDLVVDPAYRRRGIGTRLLDEVCIAGRRMGKQVVMCHVNGFNTASRQLMTRYGFRQVTQRWSVVSALIFKQPEFLSLEKGLAPDWDAQTSLPLPLQSWEQQ
jgi:GNAT superfamily N-acetyltransferase